MARIRSVDFLPEIFQTDANKQFLAATLDQLIQEPKFKKTQGYIGRKIGPGVNANDKYVVEPSQVRDDYQLEPGVVSLDPTDTNKIKNSITYPGINDALGFQGAYTDQADRLYTSEYYTWDSFVDWDAFVNFSQYFWVPAGPNVVEVASAGVPTSFDYTVTDANNVYTFTGQVRTNPSLTLVRGGTYTFAVDQASQFWIQTNPGVTGVNPVHPNITARDVFGVVNNGASSGTVVFTVPQKTAQDFYYNDLTSIGSVDLVTNLQFADIDGVPLSTFVAQYGGIDGITNLNTRTLIFTDPAVSQNIWQISVVAGVIQLAQIAVVNNHESFSIAFGAEYSNTQWYKTNMGVFEQFPLLTAVLDRLYYQDSINPDIFGTIDLIEQNAEPDININDILGQPSYTAPNGVVFTNGLKVKFQRSVIPASYGSGSTTVACTGTVAGVNLITCDTTADLAVGQTIVFSGTSGGGITTGTTYYVHSVLNNTQFSISAAVAGPAVVLTTATISLTAVSTQLHEYYVSGVGTAIQLLPVDNYVVPETYAVDYDNNTALVDPTDADYLTINRDSPDLNAWSRSNRWFHIDVLQATANYNNTLPPIDQFERAKRPIIQFRGGIKLFNMGTSAKAPVNTVDFSQTDAFSNVEGQTSYSVNGYDLVDGTRIIFAADQDPEVRNKIYVVNFISPDTIDPLIAQPIINLVPATDGTVLIDQCAVAVSGDQIGTTYWYNGIEWLEAQQKTATQQAPLFDIYNADGISLSDTSAYPSSSFVGTKLFSYALGSGVPDPVLGFQLKYLTVGNVGDIVFDNNLYKDTFNYTQNNVGITADISIGTPREYVDRTTYDRLLGWQTAVVSSQMRQQFKFVYDGSPLLLDVLALTDNETTVPAVQVFVSTEFQYSSNYTVTRDSTYNTTTITFVNAPVVGQVVEVAVLSNQVSKTAFYQVPSNLQQNPFNGNSDFFTLGTIRTHYQSMCQNLVNFAGKINGANNTRDLGNIGIYGQVILQQSAPVTLTGYFLRSDQYNIWGALDYNSREYQKFKDQLMEAVTRQLITDQTAGQVLDTVIAEVTLGRTSENPFYWSDMLPAGQVYTTLNYTVSYLTNNTFNTYNVYNYRSSNYQGMNVYLNGVILTRGLDYRVSTTAATITILEPRFSTLAVGDVISIQEYAETYGTFVPNTPSKLGLYPAFRPEIATVKTTAGNTQVIIGHDGSQTPLFNDIRDNILLEFETRIYNNIKLDGNPVPLTVADALPGQFRNTGYSWQEINGLLASNLLTYVGWNKLNLNTQEYSAGNPFSFNYSQSLNKITGNYFEQGAWRGINRYFYDTQQPQLTPWEMLGFSVKPDWWEITYGPAPYTGDNLVLWQDLEAGLVRAPAGMYVLPQYARPGLLSVIPTAGEYFIDNDIEYYSGDLLPPLYSTSEGTFEGTYQKSWIAGDGGPVEASWWNSSDYPFAVMRLLALTRPAKFFALFADRDLYRYNTEFDQYLYNDRYRLDANGIEVYGNGVSKASYINWIVDYNRVLGKDSTADLEKDLKNLDVRLCYRMASFSDKQYIKIYTERSSPNSTNTSLLIPDSSYDLLVYKNQPFDRSIYSSVVIQIVEGGWAVYGYSTAKPYFNTLTAIPAGQFKTVRVGLADSVQVPANYYDTITQVPYGFVFTSRAAVVNFLLSYGKYLEKQGFTFADQQNGYVLDWDQMSQEFLYWNSQGWGNGTLINLNPLTYGISVTKEQAIVDNITAQTIEHIVLDQNRRDFPARDLNIVRVNNTFTAQPLNNQSISFIDLRYTAYESMIVFNNVSLFGDLIYEPVTGARQNRLLFVGATTTEWNGNVDAQGFILNQNNIQEWTGLRSYAKGELVKYKGQYWSAATMVQPSTTFNYSDWNQSDYTLIQQGLLPNIANKANQLANSYNINSANLEADNDLLSYGLIGFRPRTYLSALNLDDVSQLNVYRQFLETKGTILAADLIGQANLGKEAAEYKIYENWGVQRGVYGANANRNWFDLRLNRGDLTSDPCLVQVINPDQPSQADQTITFNNVWNSSKKISGPNILPTTTSLPTDISLPTAGYVNLDDVDITVFNLDDPASLSANLNSITVGTKIWVAKVNDYDWNIYRAQDVPGQIQHICDNLNGTCRVIFSNQHGLSTNDRLIIRFFDAEVNGVYKVLSVSDLYTVNIALTLAGGRTVIDGNGIGFTLQTMRVAQASDIIDLPYARQILPGSEVWVDNNGAGLWEVLQKQNPFANITSLEPKILGSDQRFGASIAQANDSSVLLIGSPEYGVSNEGAVYVYVRVQSNQYQPISRFVTQDDILLLNATGALGYGNSADFGNNSWGAVGASQSLGPNGEANNGYVTVVYSSLLEVSQQQLLVQPGTTSSTTPGAGEFGYSLAVSDDERWLYIGAPGLNTVHAYGRVDWEPQVLNYVSNGTDSVIDISGSIRINNAQQIKVVANGNDLQLGVDYTVNGDFTAVGFINVPAQGYLVTIQRRNEYTWVGGAAGYDLTNVFYTADNIYSFSVRVNQELQRPFIDYTYNGTTLTLANPTASTDLIFVSAGGYFEYVDSITPPDAVGGDRFGTSVKCSTDGRQLLVSSPNATVDGSSQAGKVYVYDRNVQKFIIGTNHVNSVSTVVVGGTYTIQTVGLTDFVALGADSNTVGTVFVATRTAETPAFTIAPGEVYTIVTVGTTDFTAIGSDSNTVGTVFTATAVGTGTGTVVQGTGTVISNYVSVINTLTAPTTVLHNNNFLVNQTNTVAGATNTFTVIDANTVSLNVTLSIGDVIDIETNAFALQQVVTQNSVNANVHFGQAVDLCPLNCSLYSGAPQDSTSAFEGGVVQRNINQSRLYGSITALTANPVLTIGDTLRVNNVDCYVPAAVGSISSLQGLANNISLYAPNATAAVINGYLTITVTNPEAVPFNNKLTVQPGTIGTAFADLGFNTFVYAQTIESPYPTDYAAFGSSVAVNNTSTILAVGAPLASLYLPNTFDYDSVLGKPTTTFDGNGTTFYSATPQSGAVYTYDYFPAATSSVQTPGNFVFGQQAGNNAVDPISQYGAAISFDSGILIGGAPGSGTGSTPTYAGHAFVYENPTQSPAWTVKYIQQPTVDIRLLNSVYMYDRITSAKTEFFDFFNPLQGKVLGVAQQNLDYIGAVDPAQYNIGPVNNDGQTWGPAHVGEMWWDVSTVRFIDPNQDSIVYASRRWGQVFPGSRVDVYQWVKSSVAPANYTGVGTPYSINSYVINTHLTKDGTFATDYYFWVRGVLDVYTNQDKTLNAATVASYIENPRASGIAYIAPINASTIAIYNGLEYVSAADTIISIEYDEILNDDNVHVEYELIPQGRADGFLSDNLYRKLQDSFAGVDTFGNKVPDPFLSPSQRYGVQFRPRQSMFVDRFTALQNYITRANSVFTLYPMSESANFNLLNSQDPEPSASSGEWNKRVANVEELSYQNIDVVPLGYRYLVVSDSTQRGLWTIYTVESNGTGRYLLLTRVQNYKTSDYWSYIDWYLPGYNRSTKVVLEVPTYTSLSTLNLPVGSSVKVTANANNKWEIYQNSATGWTRVALQDGTIELSSTLYDYQAGRFGFDVEVFDAQYFDEEPVIETRKIIQAINEELFVGELLIERNKALTLIFDFILSELQAPEWLTKTSLIDVDHKIRQLIPYPNYVRDNQDFVTEYIQEVKPYHVQIRAFNLLYDGIDAYSGDATDFDVPAFYDTNLDIPQFVSPILLPYDHSTYQPFNINSDTPASSAVWTTWPWNQWYNNYLLQVSGVTVINGGTGYTEVPTVEVMGDCTVPAELTATINSLGQVVSIDIVKSGAGYKSTPTISITGGNGSGATAYPVMIGAGYATDQSTQAQTYYNLVRSFKTVIKYDRYQYQSAIKNWDASTIYVTGDRVRYINAVWQASVANGPVSQFNFDDWTQVPASELSGADRTMGYYVPGVNEPGLDWPLLVDGVDYPGVQVWGKNFTDPQPLDAIYESFWGPGGALIPTGNAVTDINVEGGEFIGLYEGHAPEELVNGAEYDTMDFRVYTRPGSDWLYDGHGFQIGGRRFTFSDTDSVFFWGDAVESPAQVLVSNATTGLDLTPDVDYTVDWIAQTITPVNGGGIALGDVVQIDVYEVGGGSQLYRTYFGGNTVDNSVVVPVSSAEISEIAFFVNGQEYPGATWEPYSSQSTVWNLLDSYTKQQIVTWGGFFWRAIQNVPAGVDITTAGGRAGYWVEYTPSSSVVTFPVAVSDTDGVAMVVLGDPTLPSDVQSFDEVPFDAGNVTNEPGSFDFSYQPNATEFSWSTPQVQYIVADAGIVSSQILTLSNPIPGTNPSNLVVTRNGLRLAPAAGIEWIGDDTTTSFGLPQRMGDSFSQGSIADSDVDVYVNNVLQTQYVDYTLTPWDGSTARTIDFTYVPPLGAQILISISTLADYEVALGNPNTILLRVVPNLNDIFAVTTWNDTAQQDIVTLCFYGPDSEPQTVIVNQPFDSTPFSSGSINFDTGSYDYGTGIITYQNNFYLNRPGITADRLWVTLNGSRLQEGLEYTVEDDYLILGSGTIAVSDLLVVTEFDTSIVPDAIAFRIFQDMRGVQATYRMTPATTTVLTTALTADADQIFVANVNALAEPNLENGIFGVLTIDGERIMYRYRDGATSSVSGLLRGTAGTAAAAHESGAVVYNMGRDNLLSEQYQDYIVKTSTIANGTESVFQAPNIQLPYQNQEGFDVLGFDIGAINGDPGSFDYGIGNPGAAVEVYVGGIRQLSGFVVSTNPVTTVSFYTPPTAGYEVTILVRRGLSWYQPGIDSASDGVSLQETNTQAARFLRGF